MNYFIIDKLIGLSVYAINNLFSFKVQVKVNDDLFNFILDKIYTKHPEIKNALLKYLLDVCYPTYEHIHNLIQLLTINDSNSHRSFLRGDSGVMIDDINSILNGTVNMDLSNLRNVF